MFATASDAVIAVSNGVAWVGDVDASAPAMQSQYAGGPQPNRLSRLDLRTGAVTHWITVPNREPGVIGYAVDGSPFVLAWSAQGFDVLLVASPGQARTLASYPPAAGEGGWSAIADGSTEWLSGPDGLYRYDGSALRRVVATGQATLPANRCI
jgi:hypothetical protein